MPTPLTSSPRQKANSRGTELAVSGMNCNDCVRHVTQALQSVSGVRNAAVSLETNRAIVSWDSDARPDIQALILAVERAGYGARAVGTEQWPERNWFELLISYFGLRSSGWQFNVIVGLAATAPLMFGEWIFQLGMARWFQSVSFALASVVQVFCGARFYRGAWSQLKAGRSNMDTLVALGSTT